MRRFDWFVEELKDEIIAMRPRESEANFEKILSSFKASVQRLLCEQSLDAENREDPADQVFAASERGLIEMLEDEDDELPQTPQHEESNGSDEEEANEEETNNNPDGSSKPKRALQAFRSIENIANVTLRAHKRASVDEVDLSVGGAKAPRVALTAQETKPARKGFKGFTTEEQKVRKPVLSPAVKMALRTRLGRKASEKLGPGSLAEKPLNIKLRKN